MADSAKSIRMKNTGQATRLPRSGVSPRINSIVLLFLECFLFSGLMTIRVAAGDLHQNNRQASKDDRFRKDVAPIIVKHCIRCHTGNDPQGDISLQSISDLRKNDYVLPGDPENSHLIELITPSGNQKPEMPKDAPALSQDEVNTIRQWIRQGAIWPQSVVLKPAPKAGLDWWAFQPLKIPPVPMTGTHESANPIDRFVLEKLASAGLQFAPIADRKTLIRRLSFDLLGLPPDPDDVNAFVNDHNPDAYERLVDRFLASPRYGERMAQHWLDLAHYADTHGFERDQRRDHAWRYRDYVIDAFNSDLPYDRFLQEQVAGDVLWPDSPRSVIATGFLAAGPWDFVGQVETKSPQLRRSARSLDLDDMATQVMTASLGLTINCARCHDHKLDPITQQDYYRLRAVFAGVKRGERTVSPDGVKRHAEQQKNLQARIRDLSGKIHRRLGRGVDLADVVGGGNGLGSGGIRQGIDPRSGKPETRNLFALNNVQPNHFTPCTLDRVDGVFIPAPSNENSQIVCTSTGLKISGLPKTSAKAWDIIRNGPVASQHSPSLEGIDYTKNGHSLLGLHANAAITFDLEKIRPDLNRQPGNSNTAKTTPDSKKHDPSAAMTFSGSVGYFGAVGNNHADAWIFLDGKLVFSAKMLARKDGPKPFRITIQPDARFLTLVSTDGGNGYSMDQIGFCDARIRFAKPRSLTRSQQRELVELEREREQLQSQLRHLGEPTKFYGVTAATPPDVRLLVRGNPETPNGPPLAPAALPLFRNLDSKLGTNRSPEGPRRSALARWITDPKNPLFRRVIVNRIWQWHFSQGIVDTPSDFGFGGDRPSHPELLDWLAQYFANSGYSLKSIHRLILTSRTYRQTSNHSNPDAKKIDSGNRLLWRQNPRRLEAEAIRDSVLVVSGCMNLHAGGPGFEDFRYEEAYAPIYRYVTADKPELWRRSIYRYRVRTTPNDFLTTFDCPDPANLTPKRQATTTPIQSLALYNNEFMLLQAGYFARRLQVRNASVASQVQSGFELAFGRQPTDSERMLGCEFIRKNGLTAFCRVLLNSNEFLYVD